MKLLQRPLRPSLREIHDAGVATPYRPPNQFVLFLAKRQFVDGAVYERVPSIVLERGIIPSNITTNVVPS